MARLWKVNAFEAEHVIHLLLKLRIMIADNVGKGDLCDRTRLKPVLFQAMEKKKIAPFLMRCARQAYTAHFPDKEKAENLAIYRAGLWYSLITGHKKPLTIEVALGIMGRLYPLVKMQAEFEILDGNPTAENHGNGA
ncbi:hypothetical protein BJAS_P3594 [Bathymodiolus japonicus methanotrophic gill symbiont]|nr:hypothetical protein BJAS_P3594 [Bathymodiolus japonicus methanotrophic gill symbiont]